MVYSLPTVLKCTRAHTPTRRIAPNRSLLGAVLVLLALAGGTRAAKAQAPLIRNTDLFAAPGSRPVATLRQGAIVATGARQGSWTEATIDGWVAAPFLAGARDSFALTIKPGNPVRLRADAAPQSTVVAELRAGMGLEQVERRGAWVHVRRKGWVAAAAIGSAPATTAGPAAVSPSDSSLPPATASSGASVPAQSATKPAPRADTRSDSLHEGIVLTPVGQTPLAAAPDGERVGTLLPGARTTVTGRDRGWIRVRVEGWAREADFSVADTSLKGAVSAADLRADPDGTVGRIVHWDVEVLAHQVSDALRKGLGDREPYLLAQGPAGENALLYLAIPPSLAATAAQIPDLAKATVTARVRTGRSEPVGVPVLELITIVQR
ncbi:MAG TPA: hypothetical protein VF761_10075 [Gemmatimonadaceae bacterium]